MKFKYLLIAVLAGAALVGCNKEANVNEDPADGTYKYMGFQIRVPSEGTTKADNTASGGYTNGTAAEQAINTLYFYFYKDGAYVTYGKGEMHSAFNKKESSSNDIEAIWGDGGKGVVVLESIMNVKPNQVICVANCAVPAYFRHQSLDDVITALATGDTGVTGSATYAELGFGQLSSGGACNFTMTNSPVFDGGKVVYAVPIDPDNDIKNDAASAVNNPVDIYIERMAAKVEVTSLSLTDNAMAANYDITLDGWALNAVATQGYFMKNIDKAWETADWAQNWLIGTNRINWAKDPHYSPADYAFLGEKFYPTSAENLGREALQSHVLQYYSWNQLTAHSAPAASGLDKLRRTYCLENTFDAGGQADARKVGTSMMVLATVKLKNQAAQDLYDYNGNVYTLADYLDHMLANVQTNYTFYVKDGNDYKVLSKDDVKASDIKKAVKVTGDATKNFDLAANQGCNNYSDGYVTVDPSGLTLYERADDGQGGYTYPEADAAHVTQAFFKDIPDIANMYKDGKMWYAIPVEHLGTKKSTNPNQPLPLEGNYGIVRNNYYKITLGELLSLGHGVFDPDEPIVPGEKANKWYLGARVNVNAWNIVTQSSNLQE